METYRSDFVVDATGRSARLAGSLGARRVVYDHLIAVAGFFDGDASAPAEEDSFTLVEAVSSGWWYSSRLPGGKLIAVYMTDGDLLDPALRQADGWLALLNKTKYTAQRVDKYGSGDLTPPRILPAHTVRLTTVTGNGWLAVGDSAVAFDPLASHGISMAMGSGFHAASSIVEYLDGRTDALRVYESLIDRSFASYLLKHHDAYLREQRWPRELFWRRRHAPGSEAGTDGGHLKLIAYETRVKTKRCLRITVPLRVRVRVNVLPSADSSNSSVIEISTGGKGPLGAPYGAETLFLTSLLPRQRVTGSEFFPAPE
jgi:hypothetical protein